MAPNKSENLQKNKTEPIADTKADKNSDSTMMDKKTHKSVQEIATENVRSGQVTPVGKDGQVRIGKKTYSLSEEFSDWLLFKIDNSHYGLTAKENVYYLKPANAIYGDYTHLLTLESNDKFSINPYSAEAAMPKRDDEDEHSYRLRLLLHKDNALSQQRILLVLSLLEHGSGITLNGLNERERVGLANFYLLTESESEPHQKLVDFTKKYGLKGLKTFLACEYDLEAGNQIIKLGEVLPQETAENIFKKYGEIARLAEKVASSIKKDFISAEASSEDVRKIRQNLLKKAGEMLDDFAIIAGRDDERIDLKEINKKLNCVKTDIMLFATAFKELSKTQKVEIGEIRATSLERKTADELSSDRLSEGEREDMLRIFLANREKDYPAELLKQVTSDFEKALISGDEFYLYKHNGSIVSFMRFHDLGEGRLYAGSFNTRPEAKGAEIGAAMMNAVMDEKAKNYAIEAVVYAKKSELLKYYRDKFKLSLVEIINNYEDTGETFYRLERNDRANKRLAEAA